jgi:hypothetical protein
LNEPPLLLQTFFSKNKTRKNVAGLFFTEGGKVEELKIEVFGQCNTNFVSGGRVARFFLVQYTKTGENVPN